MIFVWLVRNSKTQTNITLSFKTSKDTFGNSALKWEFNKSEKLLFILYRWLTPNRDEEQQNLDREANQIDYRKQMWILAFSC
jgi:hypothetical protein